MTSTRELGEARRLDLTEPFSDVIRAEYFVVGNPTGPVHLTESQGRSVEHGVRTGLAPLPVGERLIRREVRTITGTWEDIRPE